MRAEPATLPTARPDLAALEGYHSPQVEVAVRLNTNEAPEGPPQAFSEAVSAAALQVDWHRYPDRAALELRTGIAGLHDVNIRESDVSDSDLHDSDLHDSSPHRIVAENVFAANGSNEVLQTLLMSYAGSGRRVLTFEPTYTLHQHIARIVGSSVVSESRNADFEIGIDAAAAAVREHKPAVTFLCSPNNPTGVVDPAELTRAVLHEVEECGGLLVVDEAYGQFSDLSAISLLSESNAIVVTRTYSKTWAMAGARLGYLLGAAEVVAQLQKVVLPYHLDALKQAAGIAALGFVGAMEERVKAIVAERGLIEKRLSSLGCRVWPSGANFVLFRPPNGDGERIWQALVDRSVLVRNTASWPGLEGCLRVTVGSADDNAKFLTALSEAIST